MAIKNFREDYKNNPIQYRLIGLMMESRKADTAGKLAAELLDGGYLPKYSVETDHKKTVDNIRKKIERQLALDKPTDIPGEFLLAYSSYFSCSTDYLLCKTDIRTPNMDVRKMCEMTGLTEGIIKEMIRNPYTFHVHDIKYVNMLLEAKHFYNFLSAMQNCDDAINSPQLSNSNIKNLMSEVERRTNEFESKYSDSVKEDARNHWDDYYAPDEDLPDFIDSTVLDAIHDFDDLIDINYELECEIEGNKRLCLYDLFTCYQRLIDEIFSLDENNR